MIRLARDDDACQNCGLVIRPGDRTYGWFHPDTGKVQCPIAPIQPVATPWVRGTTIQDDWGLVQDLMFPTP